MNNDEKNTTETAGPMARKAKSGGFFKNRLFEARFLATRVPRLVRLARLTTFLVCLFVLGMGAYAHRVQSQVGERLVNAGELLMRYDDAERQDRTRVMEVNGQPIQ